MTKPTLNDLNAFVLVSSYRSFKRAADQLGLAPSSLSHSVRTLESNLGVRLLNRTTRSVSLTQAGEGLLVQLSPALEAVDRALAEVDPFRDAPSGIVRINAPETAARMIMQHVVPMVLDRYADVSVEVSVEGRFVDIVAAGFDAGVRLGEAVQQDMIAVRFGGAARFMAIAAPAYLAIAGEPKVPDDLLQHSCIRHRMSSGKLYRWEFTRYGEDISVDVPGRVTLDNIPMMISAAAGGLGIAFVPRSAAANRLTDGSLVAVLEDWCPEIPGLFLYYPGRRQLPSALRAFIDVLKEQLP